MNEKTVEVPSGGTYQRVGSRELLIAPVMSNAELRTAIESTTSALRTPHFGSSVPESLTTLLRSHLEVLLQEEKQRAGMQAASVVDSKE